MDVKSKSGGSWQPFGRQVPSARSSSKNRCVHACSGLILRRGVYSSNRPTTSVASAGVLDRKTCNIVQHQQICVLACQLGLLECIV